MGFQFHADPPPANDKPDGKSVLGRAKAEHEELFARFLTEAEDFESLEAFVETLAQRSWELTDQLARTSFRNGLMRGRSSRSSK